MAQKSPLSNARAGTAKFALMPPATRALGNCYRSLDFCWRENDDDHDSPPPVLRGVIYFIRNMRAARLQDALARPGRFERLKLNLLRSTSSTALSHPRLRFAPRLSQRK